jgi:16S rRNA (guanine527-N7)-methyltransferase
LSFSPEDFVSALARLGISVSRETLERLTLYAALLVRWQKRINLVAPATLPALWHRHMLDSAQLLPLIPESAEHLIDLGSGAGFPGLVIAICRGRGRTDLYESDERKSAFLAEVIRQTAAPARVVTRRLEESEDPTADILLARALAPFPKLFDLVQGFWHPGLTGLFLKGRALQAEIDSCAGGWRFAYDLVPSVTDSAASVLVVRSLSRV